LTLSANAETYFDSFMRRFSRLLSLVLLAVWLPATQHCALEAAGVLPRFSCDDDCIPGVPCTTDDCASLESALFKTSNTLLTAPAPHVRDFTSFLCAVLVPPLLDEETASPSFVHEGPPDWVADWHFVRRDAPPSRAPALLRA
jgi:hypothetical protein